MNLFQRILHWRRTYLPTPHESAQDMCRDFAAAFPGRCMICSYHAFGRRECLSIEPTPVHECVSS